MPIFNEFRLHADHYAKVISVRREMGIDAPNSIRIYKEHIEKVSQSNIINKSILNLLNQ
jgi:sRNA-binding carbon storage regulator CsrA